MYQGPSLEDLRRNFRERLKAWQVLSRRMHKLPNSAMPESLILLTAQIQNCKILQHAINSNWACDKNGAKLAGLVHNFRHKLEKAYTQLEQAACKNAEKSASPELKQDLHKLHKRLETALNKNLPTKILCATVAEQTHYCGYIITPQGCLILTEIAKTGEKHLTVTPNFRLPGRYSLDLTVEKANLTSSAKKLLIANQIIPG